jgi:hypothetical protein
MSLPKKRTQELVSAPAPLTISGTDGDRTFLVSKPTKKDSLTIYNWAVQHLKEAKPQGLSREELDGLPPHLQELMVKEYAKAARGKRRVTEEDVQEAMLTPEGMAFMLWVSARKQEPGLKLHEVQALVTADNYEQVFADFGEATGIEDEEGGVDPKAPGSASSSPTS